MTGLVPPALPLLAFSRPVTLAGWFVLAAAFVGLVIARFASRGRFPDGVALLRAAMQNVAVRAFVLLGWVWLGWHFFVRTSR